VNLSVPDFEQKSRNVREIEFQL